jgi:hypothetical protein
LSYQWFKDGALLAGATSNVFNLDSAQTNDAGSYVVTVSNFAGSTNSQPAVLTVIVPPTITAQSKSQTVNKEDTVTLFVTAAGTAPMSYQWTKDNTNILGATTNTFVIAHAQTNDAGSYVVTVTNLGGSATTKALKLTVNVPPTIVTQPQSLAVTNGGFASFSVSATGAAPLIYQWLKNGTNITGASNIVLTIASAQPSDAANYTVVVTNNAGSAASRTALLTVNVPPTIIGQPQSVTIVAGANTMFRVSATGTAPLSYQWFKDGAIISNATGVRITITNALAANAGNYSVVVSNVAGTVRSQVATLTVNAPLAITAQPQSVWVAQGSNVSFSVTASGAAPLNYQWFKDGAVVTSAANAVLTLANARPAQEGN